MQVSRGIGWSNESNLLYQILKQLNKLTSIMFGLKPKYKVFTALLSQSGNDDTQYITSGDLTIGVTYWIDDATGGADFTNVGAPNNNVGTYFIATGTTPNSWGIGQLGYNAAAPVATVLENTIGNVWFTYNDFGKYNINSEELFVNRKTFINGASLDGVFVFNRLINEDATGFDVQRGYFLYKQSDLLIRLSTLFDAENFSNDIISNPICLEIRVYN